MEVTFPFYYYRLRFTYNYFYITCIEIRILIILKELLSYIFNNHVVKSLTIQDSTKI